MRSAGGAPLTVEITKGEYDDIGLEFSTPLMDKKHHCENKCIFCFIDQLPRGLRKTLYFKDDDSRLSFLHGNYVTLTNIDEAEIDRIISMHITPINVSVHTTNPDLRIRMMKNPHADKIMDYLARFKAGGTHIRAQIVLCRGINDGDELLRTMRDLETFYPALDSVSIYRGADQIPRRTVPAQTVYQRGVPCGDRHGDGVRRRLQSAARHAALLCRGRNVHQGRRQAARRGFL